eukprot:CCRYP_015428-RA/>CCRYP_015428-RA protein AED:0.64 eAED:0.46 QI:0/-1/0/1/-1/0/1/0/94
MDMQFHWLHDCKCQDQFCMCWRPGKLNYADYWTKHHPAAHHQNTRREFITPQLIVEMLRLATIPNMLLLQPNSKNKSPCKGVIIQVTCICQVYT